MNSQSQYSIVVMSFVFLFSGCENDGHSEYLAEPVHELVGTWEDQESTFTFLEDGQLIISTDGIPDDTQISWDTVDIENPKQVYATITVDGESQRSMLGIYKVVDDKLYFRTPTEYYQTIGGIQLGGPTKTEYPKDFSGDVSVYVRSDRPN